MGRSEPSLVYLAGLILPIITTASNLVGGPWLFVPIAYVFILCPLLDQVLGSAPPPTLRADGPHWNVMVGLHGLGHFMALGSFCLLLWRSLPGDWSPWVAAISTGMCSGTTGLVVAHELIHRSRPEERQLLMLGRAILVTVFYSHYQQEHTRTHHRYTGTAEDPASAAADDQLIPHVLRSLMGQARCAVDRYKRRAPQDRRTRRAIQVGFGMQVLLLVALTGAFGWLVLAWLLQVAIGLFLLEAISFIQHWGLSRQAGERIRVWHSWETCSRWSRWTLLELGLHSHHHAEPSVPFWKLESNKHSAQLPAGYYRCFQIALFQPLWVRMMKPRIPSKA